jgi:HlyD family secretion protein
VAIDASDPQATPSATGGMDRRLNPKRWSIRRWPLAARIGLAATAAVLAILIAVRLIAGSGTRTLRVPIEQLTIVAVEQGVFHDLTPLRADVVPRETVYIDASDGGRVERVLVQAGDVVQEGQPLIELSNTNLALQVIQQESQLNQAISQLQQNEIALEQDKLSNDRALAEIDFNLVRLGRSTKRRETLVAEGAEAQEQRDVVKDEFSYYT